MNLGHPQETLSSDGFLATPAGKCIRHLGAGVRLRGASQVVKECPQAWNPN
ncbi:MAG TPA: hypothetical protein VIM48_00755 [Chthoniobacterales bacterium]